MDKRIIILGAGITGLALAWFLRKYDITVLEKSGRTGGWVETIRKDGFLFEQGPRSCRPSGNGIETLKLVEELGLQEEVITGNSSAKKRFLWIDQRLQPLSKVLLTRCGIMLGKAFIKDLLTAKSIAEDISIYDFISRRFGTEVAERLIDPLTTGIYAGDFRQLSMRSCFPKLWEWEQNHGSVIRGMLQRRKKPLLNPWIQNMQKSTLFSFQNGMETLTHALSEQMKPHIRLKVAAKDLHFTADKVQVTLSDGSQLEADHVFSTLPAYALSEIVSVPLSEKLNELSYGSLAVVNIGYHKRVLNQEGFGYLIPSKEKEELLGVVWDSSAFPEQNQSHQETRLTAMVRPEVHDPLAASLNAISRHLRIKAKPDAISVTKTYDCIPQYKVGHLSWTSQLQSLTPPRLTLLGTALHGVAVNDCIATAKAAADKLICQKKETALN